MREANPANSTSQASVSMLERRHRTARPEGYQHHNTVQKQGRA